MKVAAGVVGVVGRARAAVATSASASALALAAATAVWALGCKREDCLRVDPPREGEGSQATRVACEVPFWCSLAAGHPDARGGGQASAALVAAFRM